LRVEEQSRNEKIVLAVFSSAERRVFLDAAPPHECAKMFNHQVTKAQSNVENQKLASSCLGGSKSAFIRS